VSDHHSAKAPVGKQMSRDLFFPTPIYYTDLADADAINARVKALIRAWRDDDPQGQFRTNEPWLGGWHSPTDMHTRREYDCLTREIFELMHGVYASLGYDPDYEPVCDSMWANVNPRHASNRHHTHPHALWSGVYYVQTPPECGLLYFTDPRPQTQVMPPRYDLARRSPATWLEVHYQPQAGRLIVFPAWLPHAVQPNLSKEEGPAGERISVSFNFHQRPRAAAAQRDPRATAAQRDPRAAAAQRDQREAAEPDQRRRGVVRADLSG
jgi:uncharacterized protein (TIGR02466 family)